MSHESSPRTGKKYGLKRTCEVLEVARSSVYSQKEVTSEKRMRGPKGIISEGELLEQIREDLRSTPFKGEGHQKIHARIRSKGIPIGKNRVLRVMRENNLLSPHRVVVRPQNPHDGKIVTEAPNEMWGSDGLKVRTVKDGWVWVFLVEEHWNAECLGWHVSKKGDRFAAYEAIAQAVRNIYGVMSKGVAQGLKLRVDNGTQYTSDFFCKQMKYLGIEQSFGLVRQPETNGVAERFNRTVKEQIVKGKIYQDVEELREAVGHFVKLYNEKWLLKKLKYRSPKEARRDYERRAA